MNIHEMDFRYDWLESTLTALHAGFEQVCEKEQTIDWFDGLFLLEHIEALLGIGFIALQVYVSGTVQDVNYLRNARGVAQINKLSCYNDDAQIVNLSVTRIALINAIANYYKHHDEWAVWPHNATTQTLDLIGINKETDFPCGTAARLLFGAEDRLLNSLAVVSQWRLVLLQKHK